MKIFYLGDLQDPRYISVTEYVTEYKTFCVLKMYTKNGDDPTISEDKIFYGMNAMSRAKNFGKKWIEGIVKVKK